MHVNESRRIAIIEADGGGHRLWYVKLLASAWLATSQEASVNLIVTNSVIESLEFHVHLADVREHIETTTLGFSRSWRTRWLSRAMTGHPHRLVIPDGDRWLPALALRPRLLPTSLLITRPVGLSKQRNLLRQGGKAAAASLASHRGELSIHNLEMLESPSAKFPSTVPDPVEMHWQGGRQSARAALGLSQTSTLNLLIGAIDDRKGVREVIRAWNLTRQHSEIRLAVVGQAEGLIAQQLRHLANSDPRFLFVDQYLSNEAFDQWITAADRVLTLYHNVGSSGVALKCWALDVPVVVFAGSHLDKTLNSLRAKVIPVAGNNPEAHLAAVLALPANERNRYPVGQEELQSRTNKFVEVLLGIGPESASFVEAADDER